MADTQPTTLTPDQQIVAYQKLVKTLNQKLDVATSAEGKKAQDAVIAQYDERIGVMHYNVQALEWQALASNVMLWVVVAVVLTGLAFSGIQLFHAIKLGQNTDGSFEVSAQGLKITSAIVGVVILGMSIAFVLIFVDDVYSPHVLSIFDSHQTH
jgi:hypothetical protein